MLGIKLYISKTIIDWKHSADAFFKNPNEIFYNVLAKEPARDTLSFYLSKKKYSKLSKIRYYKMLNSHYNISEPLSSRSSVKCKIYNNNKILKAKVKIPGQNSDHFSKSNKWSLRIKLKENQFLKGTNQFNLLLPKTRGYLFDYILNQISKDFNIISIDYEPYRVFINDYDKGIYLFESFFNKYLIEKNRKKNSLIFTFHYNKINLNHPSKKKITASQKKLVEKLENDILNKELKFDDRKLLVVLAIGFLFESSHHLSYPNLHWYYNPHTNLLEPIIRETYFSKKIINENIFKYEEILKSFDNLLQKSNPYILEYLKDNLLTENNISDFHNILEEIMNNYEKYSESSEFIYFHKVLNNESVSSNWVTNLGKERVREVKIAYSTYKKNNQYFNNEFSSHRDTVYLSGYIDVNKTIEYKENKILIINKGTTLKLKNNANLIIQGGLQINGTENNPVIFENIDSTNSSIIVLQSCDTINIGFAKFYNLSSLSYDNWINTASLTFYDSNVSIKNSEFYNNSRGDDYLNIVHSNSFIIENCVFSNVLYDAIDIDYSKGKISNTNFEFCGNDAIDVSGSELIINNCNISNCNDKAISCGDGSTVIISGCYINNSQFGIVSKDLSNVRSVSNSFNNNNCDFSVYKKKEEYGPASLVENNSTGVRYALISNDSRFSSNNMNIEVMISDSLINLYNK